ncbi:transposase [Candidatus Bathyarchaeota archaeon]|nr:transposase [Candidatus Bathyarchaeota archaeon]
MKEHDAIIIEDLNVEGMKRFNGGIAKAVTLVFSWGDFVRMLDYKCKWRGAQFVKVGRFYPSSQTCLGCGHKHDALILNVREGTYPGKKKRPESKFSHQPGRRGETHPSRRTKRQDHHQIIYRGNHGKSRFWRRVRPAITGSMVGEGRIHGLLLGHGSSTKTSNVLSSYIWDFFSHIR